MSESNQITIKSILNNMKDTVTAGHIQSPGWWLDAAINLTALWQDLKDELTKAEIAYLRVVNEIEEDQDCSHAKAVAEAKSVNPLQETKADFIVHPDGTHEPVGPVKTTSNEMNEYQMFKYLEGRDKIVKEFIMLAKKRASTEDTLYD